VYGAGDRALGSPGTAKSQAEVAAIVIGEIERDLADEIRQILTDVRERYARAGRGDDDIFRDLENRLVPLTPGEPVMFQKSCQQRWLRGTFEGPVDNPDDPQRPGDFMVRTPGGRREPVFLSGVQRRQS
jgi:hypothetical protein